MGYNQNTETRSLTYTAEHILAIAAAAASFALFLPVSLTYRHFIRRQVAVSAAQRAFLVIGGGRLAAQFYEIYKDSPNQQQLEFVDDDPARIGSTIAGSNSPVVQGDLASKLARLDQHYSGIILAKDADTLSPKLLEQLVRT